MEPKSEVDVGGQVRKLRKALGLTQEGLADLADVERTYVVIVENGRNKLSSYGARQKFSHALGLSLEVFDGYLHGHMDVDAALALSSRKPLKKAG